MCLQTRCFGVFRNGNVNVLVTVGDGKFYSNGIDTDWLSQLNAAQFQRFWHELMPSLLWRILTFPMPTIAAVNAHSMASAV